MALDPNQAASTRRIVSRALLLVLPLVLAAVAAPRVLSSLRTARQAAGAATAAVAPTGELAPAAAEPKAPPPEAPSPEQIDKAFATSKVLAESERGWKRVEVIAPGTPAAPGVETTAPFQGFGLSLESDPDGASVTVDGRALGETPLLAGLKCEPGATVRILVAHPTLPPRELTTLCRADTLVKLRVRLGSR